MGLFEKIFKPERVHEQGYFKLLNGYAPVFQTWGGEIYESELVRAAIDAKARHISKLGVDIVGVAKPKLQNKLKLAPNGWQTWTQFLARLSGIFDVKNTAFIVPVLGEYGEITGIYPIWCDRWELVEVKGEPWVRFEFNNGERAAIELAHVGILVKHQLKSDFFGESNTALTPTMELVNLQNQGIREGVKSAASYKFMATMSNYTNEADLVKERTRFTENNLKKGGGVLLWPNTYKDIKQIESKPFIVDAAQMSLIQTNVYNYFGVNESILQNRGNENELNAFYEGAIEPFSIQLSEVLTKMLFTLRERELGNRIMFTANRLQYMATASKVAMVKELSSVGAIKVDEIRELFNYEPIGGDAGQFMPVRGEYYDITDKADESAEGEDNADEE